MSLTVPTAGNIAGRSATITVQTPDTGAIISEFGSKVLDLAGQWKAEQQDINTRRAALGITRDLGQARLEVEQLPPDQIGPAWDAKLAEITSTYLPRDADGNLTIDKTQADTLGLSITELSDRHTFALSEKAINLNRQQREADWLKLKNDLTTEAVTADPDTFGALLSLGEQEIDVRAAKGYIDPATAEADGLQWTPVEESDS